MSYAKQTNNSGYNYELFEDGDWTDSTQPHFGVVQEWGPATSYLSKHHYQDVEKVVRSVCYKFIIHLYTYQYIYIYIYIYITHKYISMYINIYVRYTYI
jgi:hypothetical protein